MVLFLIDMRKTSPCPTGLSNLYETTKKQYRVAVDQAKKLSNVKIIEDTHNQCKVAWNVINANRRKIL